MADKKMMQSFNKVVRNLHKEVKGIKGRTLAGLISASIVVRRSMEKSSPKIPVDIGNLRASYFTVTSRGASTAERMPAFKGEKASAMSADHATVIAEAQSEASGHGEDTPILIMGFSAEYAHHVHENVGEDVDWHREGSGAKFFEAHLKRNKKAMLEAIRRKAKIQ